MKSYFSLIVLLILSHSWVRSFEQVTEETGYTPLDVSQVTSNPQLQGLVSIGGQSATQQAIQDGSLPAGSYQVSRIISAAQNQNSYRFEVEVTNSQGNTTDIIFFTTYDPSAGTTEVTSYEVLGGESTTELSEASVVCELGEEEFGETTTVTEEINEGEFGEATETEGGFVILNPSVAQTNIEIVGILNIAVQKVVKLAIADGSMYDSPYELYQVYSVQQNIVKRTEYRFEVSVRNANQNTVIMDFEAVYYESSKTVKILSWKASDATISESYQEAISPTQVEENSIETNVINESESVDVLPAGYQEIYFDMNDQNSLVYQIAETGLQDVATKGILAGTIPDCSYVMTNVYCVSEKVEGSKNYYRFDLGVADGYGNSARFTYIVSYDTVTSATNLEEMQITNVVKAA